MKSIVYNMLLYENTLDLLSSLQDKLRCGTIITICLIYAK